MSTSFVLEAMIAVVDDFRLYFILYWNDCQSFRVVTSQDKMHEEVSFTTMGKILDVRSHSNLRIRIRGRSEKVDNVMVKARRNFSVMTVYNMMNSR